MLTWKLSDGTTVTHTATKMAVTGDSAFAAELRGVARSGLAVVCVGLPPAPLVAFDEGNPLHVHDLVTNTARLQDVRVVEAPELEWPAADTEYVPGRVY